MVAFSHSYIMDLSWSYHGLIMVLPWTYHGLTMVSSWSYHGLIMVSSWVYYDHIMVLSWFYYGIVILLLLPSLEMFRLRLHYAETTVFLKVLITTCFNAPIIFFAYSTRIVFQYSYYILCLLDSHTVSILL